MNLRPLPVSDVWRTGPHDELKPKDTRALAATVGALLRLVAQLRIDLSFEVSSLQSSSKGSGSTARDLPEANRLASRTRHSI